jgi:chorismate synthase
MNITGNFFKVMTWGESHGLGLGAVIDGCPAGLVLDEYFIMQRLSLDIPDKKLGTGRHEPNPIMILSGITGGNVTLGTPISLFIPNLDYNSSPYSDMETPIRPGHGDFTYQAKYGIAELRGGGRASGRECIARLAAGAIAEMLIKSVFQEISISAQVTSLAGIKIENENDYKNAQEEAEFIASKGNSSGGEILLRIKNLPAGIGNPVFQKLEAQLASAILSIGAVKSFEIGSGKKAALMTGRNHNDSFAVKSVNKKDKFGTVTNHAGGILAGISNGEDIYIRLAVKPTPTIKMNQETVTRNGNKEIVCYNGRYDKNITPRIVPISEAMAALVIADGLISAGFIHPDNLSLSKYHRPEEINEFTSNLQKTIKNNYSTPNLIPGNSLTKNFAQSKIQRSEMESGNE